MTSQSACIVSRIIFVFVFNSCLGDGRRLPDALTAHHEKYIHLDRSEKNQQPSNIDAPSPRRAISQLLLASTSHRALIGAAHAGPHNRKLIARAGKPRLMPKEEERDETVYAMGGRLDVDIVESAALDTEKEDYQESLDIGTRLMRTGSYKEAVQAFSQSAIAAPGGPAGRKGGQVSIFLAESLHSSGKKKEAITLLKKLCNGHSDKDVRKVAANVLFILEAPELSIGENEFVRFEMDQETLKYGQRKVVRKKLEKPPEKYSLEWYQLEASKKTNWAKPEEQNDNALAAAAIILLPLLFVLALGVVSPSGGIDPV